MPTISGTSVVGKTLTAKAGSWAPAPVRLAYQWYRGKTAIRGATHSGYALVAADAGKRISVHVTGSRLGWTTVTKVAAATKPVLRALTATPTPAVRGVVEVGHTLTARVGTWRPAGVRRSVQWLRGGKPIKGATHLTYRISKADAGKRITVRVTGTKTGYAPVVRTSTATHAVKR